VRRVGGVSLKCLSAPPAAAVPHAAPPPPPLSEERLRELWNLLLEELKKTDPKLCDALTNRPIAYDDEDNFRILVPSSYNDSEIRPHLIRLLTFLREKAARPQLNCRIEVVREEKEDAIYRPLDKYDAMCRTNPNLELLRRILPEIDY